MDLFTAMLYLFLIFFVVYSLYRNDIKSLMLRNKKFKCIDCPICCKLRVRLYKKDIEIIKTDLDYIDEEKGKKWIKRINGHCIFQEIKEGKSRCSIYKMRPEICRSYPRRTFMGMKCYDYRCKAFKLPKFMRYL
jgi:Fe-S-cluster containining protein